jgi:4-hydroxybenzoate polyprenyltransferase
MLKSNPAIFVEAQPVLRSIFIFTLAYSGFAFLVSLVREIIKDLEDAEGDLADGCKTFVIAYGVGASKRLIIVLLLLLLMLIAVAIYFLISYSFVITGIWLGIFTFLPVVYLFFKVKSASAKPDYSRISMLIKVLMICGVLSMLTLSY